MNRICSRVNMHNIHLHASPSGTHANPVALPQAQESELFFNFKSWRPRYLVLQHSDLNCERERQSILNSDHSLPWNIKQSQSESAPITLFTNNRSTMSACWIVADDVECSRGCWCCPRTDRVSCQHSIVLLMQCPQIFILVRLRRLCNRFT